MLEEIRKQTVDCLSALLDAAMLAPGDILVIGCSTSEIMGKRIGTQPADEAAEAVFTAVYPALQARGIYLAAQCCEHLNRALVIEQETADSYGFDPVAVVPVRDAGGSWASWAYAHMRSPLVVENLTKKMAAAGIDIGETCIGMHLKPVAVMVRPEHPWIGEARVSMVRTRPKLIGGARAQYS